MDGQTYVRSEMLPILHKGKGIHGIAVNKEEIQLCEAQIQGFGDLCVRSFNDSKKYRRAGTIGTTSSPGADQKSNGTQKSRSCVEYVADEKPGFGSWRRGGIVCENSGERGNMNRKSRKRQHEES